jgi:hypothetical protein
VQGTLSCCRGASRLTHRCRAPRRCCGTRRPSCPSWSPCRVRSLARRLFAWSDRVRAACQSAPTQSSASMRPLPQ